LLALVWAIGCNGSPPGASKPKGTELPKLGEYLPPLDQGRLEVAPPKGWTVPGRASKYLARFQAAEGSDYPAILVTADDFEDFYRVTDENVNQFAERVSTEIGGKRKTAVEPVRRNKFIGVTYHRRAKVKDSMGVVVERVFMDTVVGGRKYSVELRTMLESLDRDRPYLEAVVAGMRFPQAAGEAAPAATTASESSPVAEPAPVAEPQPAPATPRAAKPPAKPPAAEPPKPATPPATPPTPAKEPAKPKKPGGDGLEGLDDLLK